MVVPNWPSRRYELIVKKGTAPLGLKLHQTKSRRGEKRPTCAMGNDDVLEMSVLLSEKKAKCSQLVCCCACDNTPRRVLKKIAKFWPCRDTTESCRECPSRFCQNVEIGGRMPGSRQCSLGEIIWIVKLGKGGWCHLSLSQFPACATCVCRSVECSLLCHSSGSSGT